MRTLVLLQSDVDPLTICRRGIFILRWVYYKLLATHELAAKIGCKQIFRRRCQFADTIFRRCKTQAELLIRSFSNPETPSDKPCHAARGPDFPQTMVGHTKLSTKRIAFPIYLPSTQKINSLIFICIAFSR